MKLVVNLFLFVFISFISAPTVIALIEKNTDISMFYNITEEEIHKDIKESKADFKQDYYLAGILFPQIKNPKIISENLSKHDNVFDEIFSPPPELI